MSTAATVSGRREAAPAGPPVRRRRRVTRRSVAVGLLVLVLLGVLVALILAGGRPSGYLDPEDTGRSGTEALVEVLRAHGVSVDVVRGVRALESADVGPGTTVAVGDPRYLGSGAADLAASATNQADRIVLITPTQAELDAFAVPARVTPAITGELPAGCTSDIASSSDTISISEVRFTPAPSVGPRGRAMTLCFPLPDPADPTTAPQSGAPHGAAMATAGAVPGHPRTVALGFAEALTNGVITEDSNAGVAVRALGASPRLVWYQPEPGDLTVTASGGTVSTSPWPAWQTPAAVLLMAVVVLLAIARGRRLGRLVPEPLPIIVRAVETTESRGRLYRRAKDRDRAAAILRDATLRRLRRRLAIAPTAPAEVVVPIVTVATGLPAAVVGAVLFGPAPTDDHGLLDLGQQLADLEERARTP